MQSDIIAALHPEDRDSIRFLAPSMHNHMVAAEVRHPSYEAAKDAADNINCAITRAGISIRGCVPKAGVETSPSRRERLKSWFASKDLVVRMNPQLTFAWCERALEVWTEDGSYKLG